MQFLAHRSRPEFQIGLCFCFCCALAAGCESFTTAEAWRSAHPAGSVSEARDVERYRTQYQTNGDSEAMRWLMGHRIESGMSLAEVNKVLGEEGTREINDRWVKTNGGHYRSGDVVYKWGPDNKGNAAYLVFRDGHLVNFDPDEYR